MKIRIALCLCAVGLLQTQASAANISVEVETQRNTILLGEPLLVNISVTNLSLHEQSLIQNESGVARVEISHDGKLFDAFFPFPGDLKTMSPIILKPSQQRTEVQIVLYRFAGESLEQRLAFPRAGTYFVRAVCTSSGGAQSTSTVMPITVQIPQGQEATMWTQLREQELSAAIIQCPRFGWSREGLETLRKLYPSETVSNAFAAVSRVPETIDRFPVLIRDQPASVYSHHLALALAKSYASASYNSTDRAAARQQAIDYFRIASQMTQVPAVHEEAMVHWARLAGGEKAKEIATEFIREFPNGRYKDEMEAVLETQPLDPRGSVENELQASGHNVRGLGAETQSQLIKEAMRSVEEDVKAGKVSRYRQQGEIARRYRAALLKALGQ